MTTSFSESTTAGEDTTGCVSSQSSMQRTVRMEDITVDGSLQIRQTRDEAIIAHYVESRAYLTPPTVYELDDGIILLSDGFQRLAAAAQAGITAITVEVRTGTRQDAMDWACIANARHPRQLTASERHEAVKRLYRAHYHGGHGPHAHWDTGWSVERIARDMGLSVGTVKNIVSESRKMTQKVRANQHHPAGNSPLVFPQARLWDAAVRSGLSTASLIAAIQEQQSAGEETHDAEGDVVDDHTFDTLAEAGRQRGWTDNEFRQAVSNMRDERGSQTLRDGLLAGTQDPVVILEDGNVGLLTETIARRVHAEVSGDVNVAITEFMAAWSKFNLISLDDLVEGLDSDCRINVLDPVTGFTPRAMRALELVRMLRGDSPVTVIDHEAEIATDDIGTEAYFEQVRQLLGGADTGRDTNQDSLHALLHALEGMDDLNRFPVEAVLEQMSDEDRDRCLNPHYGLKHYEKKLLELRDKLAGSEPPVIEDAPPVAEALASFTDLPQHDDVILEASPVSPDVLEKLTPDLRVLLDLIPTMDRLMRFRQVPVEDVIAAVTHCDDTTKAVCDIIACAQYMEDVSAQAVTWLLETTADADDAEIVRSRLQECLFGASYEPLDALKKYIESQRHV